MKCRRKVPIYITNKETQKKNQLEQISKLNKIINEKTKDNTLLQKEFFELQNKSTDLAVELKIKSSDEIHYKNTKISQG